MKLKYILLYILITLLGHSSVMSQSTNVTFLSSELKEFSKINTGSEAYWPIVVNLSLHNTSKNEFTITRSSLLELEALYNIHPKIVDEEKRVAQLVGQGAAIFAAEELERSNFLIQSFKDYVGKGNLEQTLSTYNEIVIANNELEETLFLNRLTDVQAQLSQKKGTVEKRLGLLGNWGSSEIGDLFKESDGLRTLVESFANLSFVDGSSILVNPNTTAIIRKSRVDKLSTSSDTEITLVEGGLLSKLSASAKQNSTYILNAGNSTTSLKSLNFYAENNSDNLVKLTNYEGTADVRAGDITITINENEGIIVAGDNAPSETVKLLGAPTFMFARRDTVINADNFIIRFNEVPGAVSYKVSLSSSPDFDRNNREFDRRSEPVLLENLESGTNYVRIQSVDSLGLRGRFSETYRIMRSTDIQPPPIYVDDLSKNILFTTNKEFIITGATEKDARFLVNSEPFTISNTGRFTFAYVVEENNQKMTLSSTDISGNRTQLAFNIVALYPNEIFQIRKDGRLVSGDVIIDPRNSESVISGRAYPELEFILENDNKKYQALTDNRGLWGARINLKPGKLNIKVVDRYTRKEYLNTTFNVKGQ